MPFIWARARLRRIFESGAGPMAFDAFISYSHAADGLLAPALQRGLQRLAKRWNSRRALRIFRDETGLSTNPHLWSAIETALDESAWFVLLASPDGATSQWVNKEIAHWLATKSVDHLLPVVTDGTWEWDPAAGDFTADSTAVPDALRGALSDEPRHLDLRWARGETDLDLRNSRFRGAVADLAAPMHGVAKDELEGEDIRQHRRARRLARSGVSALAVLVVIAVVFGVFAVVQRNDARVQRSRAVHSRNEATASARLADARRLAAQAVAGTRDDLSLSALLAVQADRLVDNYQTRGALLNVLEAAAPDQFIYHGSWEAAAIAPDGRQVVTIGPHGIDVIDLVTRNSKLLTSKAYDHVRSAAISPDGTLLALGGSDIEFVNMRNGSTERAPLRFSIHEGANRTHRDQRPVQPRRIDYRSTR